MRYHLLGQTGLRVSELFLGTMVYSDRDELARIVDTYAEAGGNVLDTASAYGDSEKHLGEILGDRREQFVLATKYTLSRNPADPNASGNHRKNLRHSLDRSLELLQTDYIDLLWVHIRDRHTPAEETMRALDDLVRSGKVLYLGISDAPAWWISYANALAQWRGWTPFSATQVRYNLLSRDAERELLPMAEEFGLTTTVWGPLAAGVLSGTFLKGPLAEGARVDPDSLTDRDIAMAKAVRKVASDVGATPSQVALAWIQTRGKSVHPIVGARTSEQLKENLGAVEVQLPSSALTELEAAVPFELGFPADFIAECEASTFVFGEANQRLIGRGDV